MKGDFLSDTLEIFLHWYKASADMFTPAEKDLQIEMCWI